MARVRSLFSETNLHTVNYGTTDYSVQQRDQTAPVSWWPRLLKLHVEKVDCADDALLRKGTEERTSRSRHEFDRRKQQLVCSPRIHRARRACETNRCTRSSGCSQPSSLSWMMMKKCKDRRLISFEQMRARRSPLEQRSNWSSVK